MARQIFFEWRRGTASQWTTANPVLGAGEPGFETNTGQFKIGDGTTAWNSLSYAAVTTAAGDTRYVLSSVVGQPSGVASLDSGGKIPSSQLPSLRIMHVATVANQAARLALTPNDDAILAIQTDTQTTFILPGGADPTVNGNWVALPAGGSTAGLQSVSEKDQANGYPGLDATGLLKVAEFPVLDGGTP